MLLVIKALFNAPSMISFYKKAMINNHEFLADENVVNNHYEVKSYQHLILDEIAHHQNYQLTHQFNFYNTKKRFIMMTKSTSKSAHLKKILILPLFAIFFVVFILFGLSFLGLFEIVLPSSFVNNVDKQADKGGLIGIFFMALTLVVVSFSCTAPIAGTLLILASKGNEVMRPVLGMIFFSLPFAVVFTGLAMFPKFLKIGRAHV